MRSTSDSIMVAASYCLGVDTLTTYGQTNENSVVRSIHCTHPIKGKAASVIKKSWIEEDITL